MSFFFFFGFSNCLLFPFLQFECGFFFYSGVSVCLSVSQLFVDSDAVVAVVLVFPCPPHTSFSTKARVRYFDSTFFFCSSWSPSLTTDQTKYRSPKQNEHPLRHAPDVRACRQWHGNRSLWFHSEILVLIFKKSKKKFKSLNIFKI